MNHHPLLQPDADGMRPALHDDRCPARVEHAAEPCWRSEAFAEDFAAGDRAPRLAALGAVAAKPAARQRPARSAWVDSALSFIHRGGGLRRA